MILLIIYPVFYVCLSEISVSICGVPKRKFSNLYYLRLNYWDCFHIFYLYRQTNTICILLACKYISNISCIYHKICENNYLQVCMSLFKISIKQLIQMKFEITKYTHIGKTKSNRSNLEFRSFQFFCVQNIYRTASTPRKRRFSYLPSPS